MKKQLIATFTIPLFLMYQSCLPVLYENYRLSATVNQRTNFFIEQGENFELVIKNYKTKRKSDTQEIEQRIAYLQEAYDPLNTTGNTDLGNLLGSMAGTITYAAKEPADYFERFTMN